jgi:hypothetical protein
MLNLVLEAYKSQNGFDGVLNTESNQSLSKGKRWFHFYDDKIIPSKYAEIADYKCVATGDANAIKKYQNWKSLNKI